MGKLIIINHSYDLSDYFSDVSFEKIYSKLNGYLIKNEYLVNSLFYDRKNKKFKIESIDGNNLLSIIKNVDYFKYIIFLKKDSTRDIKINRCKC